jgi:hypothetical protein
MTYTKATLDLIFDSATPSNLDADYAIDCDGNLIYRHHYGVASSTGWQVDHIVPQVLGGSDALSNLRPRHHVTNQLAGGILGQMIKQQPKNALRSLLGLNHEPPPTGSGALLGPKKPGLF